MRDSQCGRLISIEEFNDEYILTWMEQMDRMERLTRKESQALREALGGRATYERLAAHKSALLTRLGGGANPYLARAILKRGNVDGQA